MDNDLLISEDYTNILKQNKDLKKEINDLKQTLYESSRQLKIKDALLAEYQSDVELAQNREQFQNQKHEAKIAGLEDTIANLRSTNSKNILYLETELVRKDKELDDFKNQIDVLKRKDALGPAVDDSTNLNEIIALTNENDLLQEKNQGMEEAYVQLQTQNRKLEETLKEYQEEIIQVKESLALKKDELSENTTLMEQLSDELFCVKLELENYKHKPLEADSKGNSLFAEVDDRRVHLQETVNQINSGYINLKQENGQHLKLISQLRKENADLRESWKKDLEEIQEDKFWVNDTLKRHVIVLEELLENNEKQLEELQELLEDHKKQLKTGNALHREFKFYHQMISDKSNEIEQWKKKYSDKSINEHLMSINLAEANKKVRLLRLKVQQQEDELKELKSVEVLQGIEKIEVICHKSKTREDQRKIKQFEVDENLKVHSLEDRKPMKSCLKPSKSTPEDELTLMLSDIGETKEDFNLFNNVTPYLVGNRSGQPLEDTSNITVSPMENAKSSSDPDITDLNYFRDKENTESNIETTNAQEKKGVTFSENTVESVGASSRRRERDNLDWNMTMTELISSQSK